MPDKPQTETVATNQSASPNGASVFSGEGRKALVEEIVTELRKDSIKGDVQAKLKEESWRDLISKFFQHPAVLLVLGFVITGIIGALLTNSWQRQEWDRQQDTQRQEWERQQQRLLDISGFNQKYEIVDEITKSVGERNAAAMAVVSPLLQGVSDKQLITDEAEPIKDWHKASNEWRVKSKILQLKIATRIKNPAAVAIFDRIADVEASIGVDVNLLRNKLVEFNWVKSEDAEKKNRAKKRIDGILNNIQRTGDDLKQLVSVLAEEARNDVKSSKP